MAKTTQNRYAGVIHNYLVPDFGKLCLREFCRKGIQKFFSQPIHQAGPARPGHPASSILGRESTDKIRDVLSAALRWEDIHADSITIDEGYCRGDWAAPKTEASNATIGVDRGVTERIHRLKLLTVEVRAGLQTRRHKLVKSDAPADLVFQHPGPLHQASRARSGHPVGELEMPSDAARDLDGG